MNKMDFGFGTVASLVTVSIVFALAGCGADNGSDSEAAPSTSANSQNSAPTTSMYPQGTLPTTAPPSNGQISTTTNVTPIQYSAEAAQAAVAQQQSAASTKAASAP